MSDLVSIIIPSHNSAKTIQNSIDSILNQTYPHWEAIIIDDCSTDDSVNFIETAFKNEERIKVIKRSWNAGPAVTRNRGISEAKGRFIAFLDADDSWHPSKLEEQVNFMLTNNLELSYTSYEVIDMRGKVLGVRTPPTELTYSDVLKSNQIGCLTAMYDVEKLGKLFMPNIAKRQDMGLWLKILKNGIVARGLVDKPLARYRIGCKSVSSNKIGVLKYQWRIYREVEKLSLIKSINYFRHYAYRGFFRKI